MTIVNDSMIPLYVRYEDDAEGLPAGRILLADLRTFDPAELIRQWGIDVADAPVSIGKAELTGQFFYEPEARGFGFEIIVSAPDGAS
jgi:hypothetical protein